MSPSEPYLEIEITKSNEMPFRRWMWRVVYRYEQYHSDVRFGFARTRESARRQALKAKASITANGMTR